MSKQAVAYVKGLGLDDPVAERVFLLLAELTQAPSSFWEGGQPEIMGLHLADADIPRLAAGVRLEANK